MGRSGSDSAAQRQILLMLQRTLPGRDVLSEDKAARWFLQLHSSVAMSLAVLFDTGTLLAAARIARKDDPRHEHFLLIFRLAASSVEKCALGY